MVCPSNMSGGDGSGNGDGDDDDDDDGDDGWCRGNCLRFGGL